VKSVPLTVFFPLVSGPCSVRDFLKAGLFRRAIPFPSSIPHGDCPWSGPNPLPDPSPFPFTEVALPAYQYYFSFDRDKLRRHPVGDAQDPLRSSAPSFYVMVSLVPPLPLVISLYLPPPPPPLFIDIFRRNRACLLVSAPALSRQVLGFFRAFHTCL